MICLDTMVLIWGVQGAARAGQEPMIDRTSRYIRSLRADKTRIMIPTPAVAEYLQGFAEPERGRQLELLARRFVIPAFDLPACYLAADLARRARESSPTGGASRQAIKTDLQIIATAVVHGAQRIVTDEVSQFERLAAKKIEITGVPDVHEQAELDLGD